MTNYSGKADATEGEAVQLAEAMLRSKARNIIMKADCLPLGWTALPHSLSRGGGAPLPMVYSESFVGEELGLVEEEIARHLQVEAGFPALRCRRTAYDQNGLPVIYETGVIRAGQYAYEIRLKRRK